MFWYAACKSKGLGWISWFTLTSGCCFLSLNKWKGINCYDANMMWKQSCIALVNKATLVIKEKGGNRLQQTWIKPTRLPLHQNNSVFGSQLTCSSWFLYILSPFCCKTYNKIVPFFNNLQQSINSSNLSIAVNCSTFALSVGSASLSLLSHSLETTHKNSEWSSFP